MSPRAPRPVLPQQQKRYGWFRQYEEHATDPKWRRVAIQSGHPLATVKAIVCDLQCAASKARPRGFLGDVDFDELAIQNDLSSEVVADVFKTLINIEWITHDYIADWLIKQPDAEDPTAAERQRNKRVRDRAKRAKKMGIATEADELILSRVTPTNDDDAARPIQHAEPLRLLADDNRPETRKANEAIARAWLFGDDVKGIGSASLIVAKQLGQRVLSADLTVRRWYNEIGGDPIWLAEIIQSCDREAGNGGAFESMIAQRIQSAIKLRENGPALPLPPVALKGGRSG